MTSPSIIIHADGASRGNPGLGGWGFTLSLILADGTEASKEGYGFGGKEVTNNQMELTAAIQALIAVKKAYTIDLYTDSKYVVDGINKWLAGWKANNWRTAKKQPVKNKELWEQLASLLAYHNVTAHHVSGHSGHEGNDKVDALANKGIDEFLSGRL